MKIDNKKIVRDYIEKVLNEGKIDLLPSYVSIDYTEVYSNKRYLVGLDGAREHIIGVRKTYPDVKLEITQQIAEADWVATSYTMKGTHSGSWMGIKPTGKLIVVTGVNIDRIMDGRIVEHGGAANLFEGLLNIGAIKIVD